MQNVMLFTHHTTACSLYFLSNGGLKISIGEKYIMWVSSALAK